MTELFTSREPAGRRRAGIKRRTLGLLLGGCLGWACAGCDASGEGVGLQPATVEALPTRACPPAEGGGIDLVEATASSGVDFVAPWVNGPTAGIRDRHVGGGIVVADLDGDSDADLLFTAPWGANALFLNEGALGFVERPDSGLEGVGPAVMASAVDLDGDGLAEVIIGTWDSVRSFRNVGGGGFVEGEVLSTMGAEERPAFVAWTDFDGDGLLDAYIGKGGACFVAPEGVCRAADVVLRGVAGGGFEDVSSRFGQTADREGLALAGAWLDVDSDLDLDFVVVNDGGDYHTPNRVFENPGPTEPEGHFREISGSLHLDAEMAGMGIAGGAIEADGPMALAISDVRWVREFERVDPESPLYALDVLSRSEQPTQANGMIPAAWAVELEDMDLDGDRDAIIAWHWLLPVSWWESGAVEADVWGMGSPLRPTLHEWEAGAFAPSSETLDGQATSWTWHTASPVDLNGDGALDLVFSSVFGPSDLQLGRCAPGRHFLEVRLEQPEMPRNRRALGARVEIRTEAGLQWRRIGVGSSGAQSAREPVAHFGLGGATSASLSIRWPDGRVSELGEVEGDQRLRVIREPER